MNSLILDFLVVHGLEDVAATFKLESNAVGASQTPILVSGLISPVERL